jgi:tetratricopeptide (TPR) repeat protein
MDAFTVKTPTEVRQAVAQLAFQKVGWGKGSFQRLERVILLDPQNAEAWGTRCTGFKDTEVAKMHLQTCETAVALNAAPQNLEGLGRAQEAMGDPCSADTSFTKAAGKTSEQTYLYVEDMGRAALQCGDLYGARAGFETAILQEDKSLKEPDQDQDDLDDTKADQITDREYLIVTLDRLHETKLSKEACSAAHPDWSGCACALDAKGKVGCKESAR